MKIVHINFGTHGSTGKIMLGIADVARIAGHEVHTFSAPKNGAVPAGHQRFGSKFENYVNRLCSVFSGISDVWACIGTNSLIRRLKEIHPDVIHLHNLHGWYLCLPMLFSFVKKNNIPVVWTLHDCWAFTGQCSHFTMEQCDRWKTGCHHCPRYRIYPYTFVDRTKTMWKLKKAWFAGVENMTIVTPSQWLANLVQESYLKDYPVRVIRNGIDLSLFKPTPGEFRKKYEIAGDKFVLLGVASGWNNRKGLDVLAELAKRLDPEKYQIVLVGTNDSIDKQLPDNIISIHRTNNQQELAEIYTAADLFVNPTREENYPTVNMEAIACGTPVLTFRTGGSPEIPGAQTGETVTCDDVNGLIEAIERVFQERPFNQIDCVNRAKMFDLNERLLEYINLYKNILGG